VFDSTGPGDVSRTLAEYSGARDQVKMLFLKYVCDPNTWHCFGAYSVHLQGGRWREPKGFVCRRLNRLWESATTPPMSNRPEDFHLQALIEPYVKKSTDERELEARREKVIGIRETIMKHCLTIVRLGYRLDVYQR
jgi:hypothetical protein